MKLFEKSGVPVLLQNVVWKSEGIATALVTFPYICAMSYLVFPSTPKNGVVNIFFFCSI
jgi:hypothetical protein